MTGKMTIESKGTWDYYTSDPKPIAFLNTSITFGNQTIRIVEHNIINNSTTITFPWYFNVNGDGSPIYHFYAISKCVFKDKAEINETNLAKALFVSYKTLCYEVNEGIRHTDILRSVSELNTEVDLENPNIKSALESIRLNL